MVLITRSKLPLKVVGFINYKLIVLLYFFSMWVAHWPYNDRSLRGHQNRDHLLDGRDKEGNEELL